MSAEGSVQGSSVSANRVQAQEARVSGALLPVMRPWFELLDVPQDRV